jgi:importin-9
VIALSKLYNLSDPRIAQIQVKGDLIVPESDRIMTRSRTRLSMEHLSVSRSSLKIQEHCTHYIRKPDPDQYTSVSADVKILKVLVEELHSASGGMRSTDMAAAAAAAAVADEEASDDDDWEDEPDALDLGIGSTKQGRFSSFASSGAPVFYFATQPS